MRIFILFLSLLFPLDEVLYANPLGEKSLSPQVQISTEQFANFQSIFKKIKLNGPDLPRFEILKEPWGKWGQKGLIEGRAMDVLVGFDKPWVTEPTNGKQFYALGRLALNGNEAFIVWGPWAWPIKMYVVNPTTHELLTSEIIGYGPQDRGWQLYVETKFIDLNNDGNLDLLVRETGESFEPDAEKGCWEKSLTAKIWNQNRFLESNLSNLSILKKTYFITKCREN